MIDFDPNKNARNIRERGLSFLAAARIFLGNTVETDDDRRDYGERRIQSCRTGGRLLVCCRLYVETR